VHGQLRFPVTAPYRQMPAAALVGIEGATLGRKQTPEFLRVHQYNVFNRTVEVNISV
jgi:hypothetical protein